MQGRHKISAATTPRNVRTFRGGEYVANLMAELSRVAIAARVGQARDEAGLKQTELADLLHVHWRTVQNWESQTNPIVAWDRLGEIATVTGKTKEWLIHGDPPEQPDLARRLEALEERVALGFEAIEAAIEQLTGQLQRPDAH